MTLLSLVSVAILQHTMPRGILQGSADAVLYTRLVVYWAPMAAYIQSGFLQVS